MTRPALRQIIIALSILAAVVMVVWGALLVSRTFVQVQEVLHAAPRDVLAQQFPELAQAGQHYEGVSRDGEGRYWIFAFERQDPETRAQSLVKSGWIRREGEVQSFYKPYGPPKYKTSGRSELLVAPAGNQDVFGLCIVPGEQGWQAMQRELHAAIEERTRSAASRPATQPSP